MSYPIIDRQMEVVKTKYPQAHAIRRFDGAHLIVVPGVKLPSGWNKTICTVLFIAPPGFPGACPADFWVDTDLRRESAEHMPPHRSNTVNDVPGFPEWKDLTWFKWTPQHWNPNRDSLLTFINVIRMRFEREPDAATNQGGQQNG